MKFFYRKNFFVGTFIVLCTVFIVFFIYNEQSKIMMATENPLIRETSKENNVIAVMANFHNAHPKVVQVILERVYLDGEISEEVVEETIGSVEDLLAEYGEWDLVNQNEAQIVLKQYVDDISPLLKINGYFGISEEGILNIYEGKPSEEKVIQSFFQINTKKLKSHQQQELEQGIPVLSRDRYEQVIKLYKKYAKY